MAESSEILVPIDLTLRFILFGLECASCIILSAPEMERVFREATEDHVSAKEYVFYRSPDLSITGRVDEYEPETVWLRIEGRSEIASSLDRIVETARFHVARLQRSETTDDASS